ncbi:MAG: STAS-like domain-containing protein [Flavobacterium sp.]|nr:STAS-like domain-containing protein [Flavobacterium sp.]
MSQTIQFNKIATSLGTRDLGAKIRLSIQEKIEVNDKVFLDFQDVEVITNSFANECFGKLREAISTETFRNKVAFINTNDFIQRVIISAL